MGKGKKRILILIGLIGFIAILCLLIFKISGWEIIRIRPDIDFSTYFRSCEPPCWLGITPGETDRDTAIELLQESPFVVQDSIEFGGNPEHPLAQQSISFDLTNERGGYVSLSNDVVVMITINWDGSLGEALEIFGKPDWVNGEKVYGVDVYGVYLFYDQGISINASSKLEEKDSDKIDSSDEIFVNPDMSFGSLELYAPDLFQNIQEYYELRFGRDPEYASFLDSFSVPWEGYGFYPSYTYYVPER